VQLDADLAFTQVTEAINTIERRLRESIPEARVIYIEPDVESEAAEPTPA
jgi:hypothetical protein